MKTMLKAILPERLTCILRRIRVAARNQYFRHFRGDYSQAGETVAVRKMLTGKVKRHGFFVEIGANDGVTVSTTLGLIRDGWGGLSVEAHPRVFARLEKNLKRYAKVKPVCAAVAPERGILKLFLGRNDPQGLLSTICTEQSDWFQTHRSEEFVEVMGVPLTELLEEHGVVRDFDLLLIDAEGMDLEILQELDFAKFRPKLIITEDYQEKNGAKFRLLEEAGYNYRRQVGCNAFWVDEISRSVPAGVALSK